MQNKIVIREIVQLIHWWAFFFFAVKLALREVVIHYDVIKGPLAFQEV